MVNRYRRRIAAMVIQLAREDPHLVKEVIGKLRATGEIEAEELRYLERIADRWIEIARQNLGRGRKPGR